MAVGRPLAVTLLVVGLAGLTAIMIWALDRSGPRGARDRRDAEPWHGVRKAAVSAKGGRLAAAISAAAQSGGGSVPRRARVRATMSSRMVMTRPRTVRRAARR